MGIQKFTRQALAIGLTTCVSAASLVGAVVVSPVAQAAGEADPVAAPGQYLTLGGSKLTMRGPQRLLLPVTLPKFTIPNLPDGSATKPAAVVQFRWRLCRRPLIGDATELSCFLMASPTQAEGKRAFVNVNVNFRKVNGVWEADPVNVPYQPRNMANIGFGMYLSPLALVAAVRADGSSANYVGLKEFQGDPAASGVEIATTLASPFDTRTVTFTTDKQTYGPNDNIAYTATIPGANFSFAAGTDTYTFLGRIPVLKVCNDAVAAVSASAQIQFQVGVMTNQLREGAGGFPLCNDVVQLPSGALGTDAAPWTLQPVQVTGTIPARNLLAQPLEPGASTNVNLTLLTQSSLSQSPEVANATPERFLWNQAAIAASRTITIAVPANGQRVDAQLDPNAQAPADGSGQGAAADSSASGGASDTLTIPTGVAAVGGSLEEAGVDLVRAPLTSDTGSAKSGSQALSVKISKKPKVGKIMTVTGTLSPKASGELTLAMAYTIEGKDVVVRVRSLPLTSAKTSVKWKLQATSPKGRYKIFASYLPSDVAEKGMTVSKVVRLK